ncbi:MAG: DUF4286 family protein [Persicimonas sp.]
MLYIVYIAVDRDRIEEWERWMRRVHVPDVLETGCFSDATMARDAGRDTDERAAYRIVYRAHSKEAFEEYQSEHAAALQEEHTERYAGAFEASRDLLDVVERFDA